MKITELKIKENIAPDVVAEVIEYISNACFVSGTYNPYYQSFAERMAIVQYFLDGIEFEDGDSLFVICELDMVLMPLRQLRKQLINLTITFLILVLYLKILQSLIGVISTKRIWNFHGLLFKRLRRVILN